MKITLGPLTMLVPVADLDRFAATAVRGSELVYARGRVEPRGEAAWLFAKALEKQGAVRLFVRFLGADTGAGREREWVMVKKRAPIAVPGAGLSSASPQTRLLTFLAARLRGGDVIPTNRDIAEAIGLRNAAAAAYQMRAAKAAGLIGVEDCGPGLPRRVTMNSSVWGRA
jgi:hypothetical protein